jgi:hypothetical protein
MIITCDRVVDLAPGFVLGALDAGEMDAVREHMSTCSKSHPELREMGGILPYLGASLEPVEPPRHLRAAVMAAALEDLRSRMPAAPVQTAPQASPSPTVLEPAQAAPVVSLARVRAARSRRVVTWLTRVAAAAVIVSLGGYAVAVQADLNSAHKSQDAIKVYDDAVGQRGARSAVLAPEIGQRGAGNAVLLQSGHVVVYLSGLAPTTGDQVYMVWSSADGGPITKDGWITVDDQGSNSLQIDNVSAVDSLWLMVCLEPNRNVTAPTGAIIVTGIIWVYPPASPTS